ncbi:MAG: hypothetical protein LBI18_07025 [Planctomycetaceae bacterium]|jgi:flagellar biosynthesis GTPase FlhF|nr:hypothetical protein [Planctomycetaceae bacterium]
MIQEQVSTSSLRCLDGNSGFGVVAQTSGMALNVSRDVSMLSGYKHYFPAGDTRNPVVFMHVVRRSGGMDRHIVSRVADCGNDYSGRTNRIAHHVIIEELDLPRLSCGPATILSQPNLFLTQWNDKAQELPLRQVLPNPEIYVQKCTVWEQLYGDAGWGGVVAERIEKGDPISVIFDPGKNILPLIAEAFTLLPPSVRWKTTFSTFFMKSQEPPSTNKIQIKCIVASSDEMMFVRLTPNTLLIDLRKKATEIPNGKYVELARTGSPKPSITISSAVPIPIADHADNIETPDEYNLIESVSKTENTDHENYDLTIQSVIVPKQYHNFFTDKNQKKFNNKFWLNAIPIMIFLAIFLIAGLIFVSYNLFVKNKPAAVQKHKSNATTSIDKETEQKHKETETKITLEKTEQKNKENEIEIINSKIEQRHEEDNKKIIAEKMEQERNEIQAKETLAKNDAENKQKEINGQKIAEENDLKNKFSRLPEEWQGLGLPYSGESSFSVLQNSQFLDDIRDRVKISYRPFVNLELKTDKIIQIMTKIENAHCIEFWYEEGKNVQGNPIQKIIARIDLQTNGLNFKFDDQLQGHKTDADTIRRLNRILLAKLKIEIQGTPIAKEVTLYTPAKVSNIDTKNFVLWAQDGKEYILSQKDNTPLYFDIRKFSTIQNSQEQVQLTNPKKNVPLQKPSGYVQEISFKGEQGTCNIKTLDSKTLALELEFCSYTLKKMLDEYDDVNKQIPEQIRLYNEIEKKKKEAERILFNVQTERQNAERTNRTFPPKNEIIRFTEQKVGGLNLTNKETNLRIKETEKEIKNYDKNIGEVDSKLRQLQTQKQKIENKINDNKAWNYIRLEEFSLYLLKPGTSANEINNKENQLLLLDVKP